MAGAEPAGRRTRPAREDVVAGASAGVLAAACWAAAEPALGRVFGTPYSDVRMLGRLTTRSHAWPFAGLALHLANGAVFGAVFARLGLRGARRGVIAAELENLVLWPTMLAIDRLHPDRREGVWPALFRSRRVAAYEVAVHALFGAVLGELLAAPRRAAHRGAAADASERSDIVAPALDTEVHTRSWATLFRGC